MKTTKTLLQIIRKKYNKPTPFSNWGICDMIYCSILEEEITKEERSIIIKLLKKNRPKDYEKHLPWYFDGNESRIKWLDRQIKRLEKK